MEASAQEQLLTLQERVEAFLEHCDNAPEMTVADQAEFAALRQEYLQLEAELIPDVEPYRNLMRERFIGAEEWKSIFGEQIVAGSLPSDLSLDLLTRLCPLSKDGKTKVCESHVLIWIPEQLKGEDLTVNSFAEFGNEYAEQEDMQVVIFQGNQSRNERQAEVYNQTKAGHWALIPLVLLPESKNKSFANQEPILANFKQKPNCENYETAEARDLALALGMTYLLTGEREFASFWGFCAENSSGGRAALGHFRAGGLVVGCWDGAALPYVGRAVFWKLLSKR
jgi:hypothetical protein